MSNDGSVNAWVYPLKPRIHCPEPVIAPGSSLPVPEEVDGTRSRAATPREGTPDSEGERAHPNGGGTEEAAGNAIEEEAETVEKDVEMTVEDVIMTEEEPKSATAAPSRQSSPPSAIPPVSAEPSGVMDGRRLKQLRRFRHSVCHSASLLSLSFDPMGK